MHVEPFLKGWLTPRHTDVRFCTERPGDMTGLPVVQIAGIGGSDDQYDFGAPRVDVDVFHATRDQARTLAQDLEADILANLPGDGVGGVSALHVTSFMSPTWTPDDNTNLRRFTFSLGLRLHDRSAS